MIWRLVRFLLKMLAAGVILIVLLVVGGILIASPDRRAQSCRSFSM